MAVWDDVQQARPGKTLRERLEDDPDCSIAPADLDKIFDPRAFLSRVDVVFDRLEQLSFDA
jgi:adenylosuccinate lyase